MSSHELIPLFPSATHPAIPISVQILSKLRHLTAPGKGNDLKGEERTALVGVAALLGCERIQSKDLLLSSAQKASSVSPSHFRSTLSKCRILLESIPSPNNSSLHKSPSKNSSTSTSTSISNDGGNDQIEDDLNSTHTPCLNIRSENLINPLQTPKKKYKFSSGIDISSLVKSPNNQNQNNNKTPKKSYDSVIASPLRQSIIRQTSNQIQSSSSLPESPIKEVILKEIDIDIEKTPSKKNKYNNGIDLENPPSIIKSVKNQRNRNNENSNSFFALRPGNSITPSKSIINQNQEQEKEEESWMHRRPEETHKKSKRFEVEKHQKTKKKNEIRKVDWTYKEDIWGKSIKDDIDFENIWKDLDLCLEKYELPSIANTEINGNDIENILLNALMET
ncbi:uncharacterized protein I206_104833 [Kwoniella pini CBS 10737]|uniref:Uncharacterized protein n=1 Tax=Kwoniella pini CBS 10737 TaxID=1296096 RepID=A0A1B9I7X7_9TREE|nr:uncharacterized protein I206_02373 [Kwoniella pini CBS 10737]OCF51658.1 hypothetical protein I206_02373 [Kwoniella pini CBS 10737]